jgi:hypothetical protein
MPKEALLPELRAKLERLRSDGYYPFVALFTWDPKDDAVALGRFRNALKWFKRYQGMEKPGIDPQTAQTYNLTGARSFIVIGYSCSPKELQTFCSSIVFNTGILANFHHAVEAHEFEDVIFPSESERPQ